MPVRRIPLEMLVLVFAHVDDLKALVSCARTCRFFYKAATPLIFREIKVKQLYKGGEVGWYFESYSPFATLSPHLRVHVRSVRHIVIPFGFSFEMSRATRNWQPTGAPWVDFISLLPNMTSYSLDARRIGDSSFMAVVNVLLQRPNLTEVRWAVRTIPGNFDQAPLLRLHRQLRVLSITNLLSSHVNLDMYIENLPRLEVLRLVEPSPTQITSWGNPTLKELTCRDHTWPAGECLTVLQEFPNLKRLNITYRPKVTGETIYTSLGLRHLRHLTVWYDDEIRDRTRFMDLKEWILRVAPPHTPLESLTLVRKNLLIGMPASRATFSSGHFVDMLTAYPLLNSLEVPSHYVLTRDEAAAVAKACPYLQCIAFSVYNESDVVGDSSRDRRRTPGHLTQPGVTFQPLQLLERNR
ncbi:hypothetical protein BV25DRAFT_1902177 [Artomyces pyxidatus]|uniref:Uncharacterized protein n=1 Tax=Artomyces pyxidatus TaxID=48021 RepID=A0ACB8SRY2_9AGAM|nr:hypothetical protein BV25DRAFT_1902177 [Artomyces pyxidatus]